ncbi:MAG: hypothetical protein SFY92_10340, partial [Verrucomicrobiae bacterium]|nr:hypothetical protein [Verrucomicrobiae bacterium]
MTRTFGLLTILLVLVTAAPLTAKTVSHPKNSPSFTIDFPDSWKVEVTPEGEIYAASPDEEVEYELWRLPQKEVSSSALAALKVAVKDVNEYIREHVTSAKFGDWNEEKYNDMDFLWAEG